MKKLLLIIARYILTLIILVAVVYGFAFVYYIARLDSAVTDPFLAVQPEVLHQLYTASIPIIVASAIMALFQIVHVSKYRFIMRFVLTLLVSVSLFLSFMAYSAWSEKVVDLPEQNSLNANMIYTNSRIFLFMTSINADGAGGIWYRDTGTGQVIRFEVKATLEDRNRILRLDRSKIPLEVKTLNGSLDALFTSPNIPGWEIPMASIQNMLLLYLKQASASWLSALIHAITLAFAIVGMWFWVRLSRWPLWNLVWCVVWLVGLYFVASLVLDPSSKELLVALNPLVAQYALPGLWVLLSGIFLLLSLLLPPFKDWKKELGV